MDREGIRLWPVTRCSTFIEPDINALFSKVHHACGRNCVMLFPQNLQSSTCVLLH